MTTLSASDRLEAAPGHLQRYGLAVVAASLMTQVVIAATGSEITLLAGALTGVIALGYAGFLLRVGADLGRVRFGKVAAHALTYAAVCGGYLLHFFVLALTASPTIEGPGGFLVDPGWFGAAISMPALWSLGLVAHILGAALGRGFEARR